jgi:hypothetical protein
MSPQQLGSALYLIHRNGIDWSDSAKAKQLEKEAVDRFKLGLKGYRFIAHTNELEQINTLDQAVEIWQQWIDLQSK